MLFAALSRRLPADTITAIGTAMAAQMKWRRIDHRTLQTPTKVTAGVAAT